MLITKNSKVSQSTIKEVQKLVRDKSQNMISSAIIDTANDDLKPESKKKNEKPAVGGMPEVIANSRMTYLAGNESISLKTPCLN